jgi:hypothetical protein
MSNKFHAIRTCGYASRLEAQRAWELKMLEQAGELSDLREQPHLRLADCINYRPDFSYTENGVTVYEDTKGVYTDRFRMICDMWPRFGDGPLRIMVRAGKRIVMKREIPGGNAST